MNRIDLLAASALTACVTLAAAPACAQEARDFSIPAGSLQDGLTLYATQADRQIFFSTDLVAGLRTPGLRGRMTPSQALGRLLAGSGLAAAEPRPGVIYLRRTGQAVAAIEAEVELEDVVVTGTLLRSSGGIASPVVVLGRDELDRRGLGTVAETLIDLPQNYAGSATPVVQLANADSGASNNVYATGVNLRGLGPASTLVLVNGRRMAGTGSRAEFADVSALPSAAVERVDVLLDGASALYGADAVAGVVNVIMRRSFEGQESRVRASAARGGAEDLIVSHLAGHAWSSGAAYLSWEYQTTNALSSYDRAFTADGDLRPFGGTDHRFLYGTPGNIVAFNAATSAYVSLFAIRPNASGTAQTVSDFAPGAANLQSTTAGTDLIPSIDRHSAYGRFVQSLASRLEVSGDVRYSRRAYAVALPASAGIFSVTRANPFFVSPTGAAAHTISYSFLNDIGLSRHRGSSESLGLTLGARYDVTDDWVVDGYLTWAEERGDIGVYNRVNSRFAAEALGTLPDDPATPYRAAVDGYLNLFGSGSANSRAVLDFVGRGFTEAHNRSRAASANLLAQGTVLRLPGGDVELALGLQARKETFETEGVNFLGTVVPTVIPTPGRERTISAVFAEARIPLIGPENARPGLRSLDLSIAGRFEEYDDFGTTSNPKLGLVWSPVSDLRVRLSWGTSFRAGALPQLFDSAGAQAPMLARADGSRALVLILGGGNPDLRPETAETLTFGLDYRPSEGPALSLNYFDTQFSDRIARPVNENINGVLTDPALASFVRTISPATNPADLALIQSYAGLSGFLTTFPITTYAAIIDGRWVNTGDVRVRGIDASARQTWDVAGGALSLDGSASWILDYETRPTPTAPVRQVAGLVGYPSRLRARAGGDWAMGDLQFALHWTYVEAYEDRLGTQIDAWNTVDAQLHWSIDQAPRPALRLTLSVENLFDEDPPFYDAPTGYGFDAGGASLLGRVVSLQLTRRW